MAVPTSSSSSELTPELVKEIADLVYRRLQQELRYERERARGRLPQNTPRRRGGS